MANYFQTDDRDDYLSQFERQEGTRIVYTIIHGEKVYYVKKRK